MRITCILTLAVAMTVALSTGFGKIVFAESSAVTVDRGQSVTIDCKAKNALLSTLAYAGPPPGWLQDGDGSLSCCDQHHCPVRQDYSCRGAQFFIQEEKASGRATLICGKK